MSESHTSNKDVYTNDFSTPHSGNKPVILIPSYRPHLSYVGRLLASLTRYATDSVEIKIRLVVSEADRVEFHTLAESFKGTLDVQVVSLKEIVASLENEDIDEGDLLRSVGKFNFQSMKKLWGVRYFSEPITLVMDSEGLAVRSHRIGDLFDDWQAEPIILYSRHASSPFQRSVTENCFKILGLPWQDLWMFDYQYWFFEAVHVKSLFERVRSETGKTLFQHMLDEAPIFEFNLYALHIMTTVPAAAKFVDADALLKAHLQPEQWRRYQAVMKNYDASTLEHLPCAVDNSNLVEISNLFTSERLHMFKYDDRHGNADNIKAQRQLIELTPSIWMLPCYVSSEDFEVDGVVIPRNAESNPPPDRIFTKALLKLRARWR